MSQTLAEITEPFFQYVCRLNRAARKTAGAPESAGPNAKQVEAELLHRVADAKAQANAAVKQQGFEKIEPVLLYFADSMVRQSTLPFARAWTGLAAQRGLSGGDEAFFDELDDTLRDNSESAVERLQVFYTAIGLGFTGWYAGQHDFLRKKMLEIASRLRGKMDADLSAKLCPDAYQSVNTADLVRPASRLVAGVVVALCGLMITIAIVSFAVYLDKRGTMNTALERITNYAAPAGDGGGR